MTVGEKIKYIRTFRGMTQQQLGVAIGLSAKGADNRMAQYETNYRVPKKDMLEDIAEALDVNLINFISPVSGSAEDIMQTFFWLDEDNPEALHFFPMVPSKKKYGTGNAIKAQYDNNDDMPSIPPVGMWFHYSSVMTSCTNGWYISRNWKRKKSHKLNIWNGSSTGISS